MSRKTVKFNQSSINTLPNNQPVVYKIQSAAGETNYVGVAKRGRVQERIREHLDKGIIPGAKVQIEQMPSIQEAQNKEKNIIARTQPKFNEIRK